MLIGIVISFLLTKALADAYDTTNVTASPSYKSPLAALYDEIMSELPHPDVRPIRDPNGDIMMVTLTAGFDQILNVDDVGQTVTVLLSLDYMWKNELLSWDPDDFGGLSIISIRESSIWKPSLNAANRENLGEGVTNPKHTLEACHIYVTKGLRSYQISENNVITRFDGQTIWTVSVVLTVSCPLNMVDFPKDAHPCQIVFGFTEMGHADFHLQFSDRSIVYHSYYSPNSTSFELTNMTVTNLRNRMVIDFNMKRVPALFDATIIKPVIGVAAISPLSLLLPPDSEAKLDLQITSVLALSVYMMIVVDLLPPYLPDQAPKVVEAMMLTLILNIVVVVLSTLVLRMVNSMCAMPNLKVYKVVVIVGKFLLVPHPGQMCAQINHADDDQKQVEASDTKLQCVFESSELSYIVNWIKNKEYEDDIKCRWYHIGMVCDRILLISSLWVVVYLAVQLS